ncbi:HAD family phosphatase [Piscinibacter sp. XHJ-5]|uniref:HAD family hydrolase n=1 Tax=Piscinibacter sp. XHJ-5 TaxID=3037797 RepID=UPI002452969B|nr:HAD family phosphatase [Piscinibacter sp. XHJ-5]
MNVVFDFGGVVFRWQPHEFMARLLPHHATGEAAVAALVTEFFQGYSGDWAEFDRGMVDEARLAQRIAWRTGIALPDVQKIIDAVPFELQPVEPMVRLMERLREGGHRLFFLSNMPAPYAQHLETTHEFMRWFEGGVFSSRVQLVKPEPAIFHEAVRRFGAAPNELLFIDDFALNVKAARALGWQAVHCLSAQQVEADLAARGLL